MTNDTTNIDISTLDKSELDLINYDILIIGDINTLKNRMDKNIYNYIEYLVNHSQYNIKLIDNSYNNYDISVLNKYDIRPILFFLVFNDINNSIFTNIDQYTGITIYDIEDCYEIENLTNIINKYNFDYITYKYKCPQMEQISTNCKCNKYIYTPHYIDTSIFKIYPNINKDIDILIYGNLSDFYPFRKRIFNILNNNNISYQYLPHPGYLDNTDNTNNTIIGKDLALLINRAKYTLVTCSAFNYLVKKYMEITACGSIMIGNYPIYEDNPYKDKYIHLENDMNDNTIINIIQSALEQYDENKDKFINYCHNYTRSNFSYNNGTQQFDNLINLISK
tara:strand:- start:466 stop:1473 length:1008 start_codon:yes stop_codon:yes gene_type:complete